MFLAMSKLLLFATSTMFVKLTMTNWAPYDHNEVNSFGNSYCCFQSMSCGKKGSPEGTFHCLYLLEFSIFILVIPRKI